MSILLFLAAVVSVTARPSGPPENVDYLHTVDLQYYGSQLMGLNQIDGFADVDPAMQASLKKAIEEAWPSYYADLLQPAASPTSAGVTSQPEFVQSTTPFAIASTGASAAGSSTVAGSVGSTSQGVTTSTPSNPTGSTPSMPHRFKRAASSTPQSVVAIQPTNPTPIPFPGQTVNAVQPTNPTPVPFPQPVNAVQPTNPTPSPVQTTTDFWSRTDLVHFKINFNPFSIVTTDVPANSVPTAHP